MVHDPVPLEECPDGGDCHFFTVDNTYMVEGLRLIRCLRHTFEMTHQRLNKTNPVVSTLAIVST